MFTFACQQFFKCPSCEYGTVFEKVPNLNLNNITVYMNFDK